ncbi:MAG: NAD(P)-dependent oxidoreductase [Kiloniellales bacterium]
MSATIPIAIGLIGLGRMGRPMARHFAAAGHRVLGYDNDRAALAAAAVEPRESPRAVAAADLTLVLVPDDEAVMQVATGSKGLFSAPGNGAVVAVCSSVRPDTLQALAAPAAAAGFELLDLPLTKGVEAAEDGTMTLLAGGKAETVERLRPALSAVASAIHHVGPLGAGQIAKTVNNLLLWSTLVAAAEALGLGARLGVEPAALRRALKDCSADSWVLRRLDRIQPTWPAKDMRVALAIAEEAGLALPLMQTAAAEVGHYDRSALDRLLQP